MGCIGLGIWIEQVLLVKVEKVLWITLKHGMRDQLLSRKMPTQGDTIDPI